MVVSGSSSVRLSWGLVVVRVVCRSDACRVVGMLLELYEGGLGGRHRGDVPRVASVLVVGSTATTEQVVMVSFQRLPCGHGGRRWGVRAPSTTARPEGAPEIRVIQRGYLRGPQGRNVLSCPGG